METRIESLRSAHKRAAVIAISLMGSILVYVVVAELLRNLEPPWRGVAFTSDHRYYDYVRYGLLALGLIGVLLAAKISTAVNLTPEKLTNPLPALLTHAVVLAAACDMLGTCGFVLFLMAGNITDVYIFGGLSLGLSVAFFPGLSHWKELAESWLRSPTSELDEQPEHQRLKPAMWKASIVIMGASVFLIVDIVFCRDNALEEEYTSLLWACFFPLTVIALLYFISVVAPRNARNEGRKLDCRPWLWHLASILMSLLFGSLLILSVQSTLRAAMDWLNATPVKVESVISGLSRSNHCRVKVDLGPKCSICLQHGTKRPIRTPWSLEKMSTDQLSRLLAGKRVILVGRKSFAGTVIDEIRFPPDKAIERTSSGITDHTR